MYPLEPLEFPGNEGRQLIVKTNLFPLIIGNSALRIGIYQVSGIRFPSRNAPPPPMRGGRRQQRPQPSGPIPIRSNDLYHLFLQAYHNELNDPSIDRIAVKGHPLVEDDGQEAIKVYVIPAFPPGFLPRGVVREVSLDHKVRGRLLGTNQLKVSYMRDVDFTEQSVYSDFRDLMKVGLMDSLTSVFTRRDFFRIKNDLYTFLDKRVIANVLDILMGMKVRVHTEVLGQPMLSINMTFTSCLRVNVPLLLVYAAMVLKRNITELTFQTTDFADALISGPRLQEFRSLLADLEIMIPSIHDPRAFERTRLVDITEDPASTFSVNGVNLNTYYMNAGWRIDLPHMNAIVVKMGPRRVHIPMEHCRVSTAPQKLSYSMARFRRDIITATAVPPVHRFRFVEGIADDLDQALSDPRSERMLLTDLQVKLQKCIALQARVLDQPETHHKTAPNSLAMPYRAKDVKYVLLDLSVDTPPQITTSLVQNFAHFLFERLMITIDWRDLLFEHHFRPDRPFRDIMDEFERVLYDIFRRLDDRCFDYLPERDQLIFFLVIPDAPHLYSRGKQLITQAGYVCQFIREENLERLPDFAVSLNLGFKINAKLGGLNNVATNLNLNSRWSAFISVPTMFIGIDTRNSKERNKRGIVAISVSINPEATKYKFFIRRNHETSRYSLAPHDWKEIIFDSLAMFKGPVPQRVFILRAGMDEFNVSKGEALSECIEIDAVLKCWFERYAPDSPVARITYIGYNRAHNVRFMQDDQLNDESYRANRELAYNVPRGTVIDHTITHPSTFYLVSHATVAGTLKPAKYYIVTDDNGIGANDLLVVIYTLCCLAPRCNFPIRKPLPIAYCMLLLNHAVDTCSDAFADANNGVPIPENLSTTPFFV